MSEITCARCISRGHWIGRPPGFVAVHYLDLDEVQVREQYDDSRPCTACGQHSTPEGYDACLGHLDGVAYACCGHGLDDSWVYVSFEDDRESLYGDAARDYFRSVGHPVPEAA